MGEGRQAYIVCPMVEENDQLPDERKAVTEYAKKLQSEVFPDLKVAFVHGKMKPKEKDAVMAAFAAHETDILVSTTVIEVGVDVPNAAVMVIENAERFGLSQLHQLRGRVGRGKHQSYCILISDNRNEETRQRLKVMTKTTDGFQIAEEDLRLRGPGDFFGQRSAPARPAGAEGGGSGLRHPAAAGGPSGGGAAAGTGPGAHLLPRHGRAGDGALHTAGGCPELKLPGRSRGVFAVLCDLLPRSLVITAEGGEASDRSGAAL